MFSSSNSTKLKRYWHVSRALWRTFSARPVIHNLNVNVTNACNQNCPLCNARLDLKDSQAMSAASFNKYLTYLKPYLPATCTLSGGEPTLAAELPQIISLAQKYFPFGVGLSTNLYGQNERVRSNLIAALKAGIRISASLDGLTDQSNQQRGVSDAWQMTLKNIKFISEQRIKLSSSSPLVIHTVLSNLNLPELEEILALSKKCGWQQRIAPLQHYSYNEDGGNFSALSHSEELEKKLAFVHKQKHIRQDKAFINGISLFAADEHPKLCPYIIKGMKYLKVFLDHDGSISLCNREVLGNLNEQTFKQIISSSNYKEFVKHCKSCRGCWTACFVEPAMYIKPFVRRRLKKHL